MTTAGISIAHPVTAAPSSHRSHQIPTTVMGVVDASIGIKTAVNFHEKKNKLGTYCPPLGVFYDTSFLATLDSRNISNGSAEIFKMACIKDRQLFELMEQNAEQLISQNFQVSLKLIDVDPVMALECDLC